MSNLVMCIDSSKVSRLILRACLRREGFTCLGYNDGGEALVELRQRADQLQGLPTVFLIADDLPEPIASGYELARLFRAEKRFDASAIIILYRQNKVWSRLQAHETSVISALARFSKREETLETRGRERLMGVQAMLPKPFITRTIVDVVSQYAEPESCEWGAYTRAPDGGRNDSQPSTTTSQRGLFVGRGDNRNYAHHFGG